MSKWIKQSFYMHTINGCPGMFDGDQICYTQGLNQSPNELALSLRQIRNEQQESKRYRSRSRFSDTSEYGYVRVSFPTVTVKDAIEILQWAAKKEMPTLDIKETL